MQRLIGLIWSWVRVALAEIGARAHAPPQLALAYGERQQTFDTHSLKECFGFNPNHETGIGKAREVEPIAYLVRQLRCLWRYPQLVPAARRP